MLYSGLDLHKHTIAIHTVDAAGTCVRRTTLPTERVAIARYFDALPGPHRAVVESTGMWYWLRDLLVAQHVDLRLGHAKYLKAISYAKVKTDAIDAATLAQLLRAELIPEAHMISDAQRELRDCLRARLILVTRALQARRSMTVLLEKYNVATPEELPALPRLQADLFLAQRTLLLTQIRRLEAELRGHLVDRPDLQRLVWIPGIGARTAYTLLLEIDDIHRFPSVRHFHSYCRLVPGSQDSGGKTRHKRSKDGNRYLKIAFHHAAIRAVQYFPEIRTVYQDWARRKGTPIARALVAKELAQIVFFVLTKEAPYNDRFASITLTQRKLLTWPRRANPPA